MPKKLTRPKVDWWGVAPDDDTDNDAMKCATSAYFYDYLTILYTNQYDEDWIDLYRTLCRRTGPGQWVLRDDARDELISWAVNLVEDTMDGPMTDWIIDGIRVDDDLETDKMLQWILERPIDDDDVKCFWCNATGCDDVNENGEHIHKDCEGTQASDADE